MNYPPQIIQIERIRNSKLHLFIKFKLSWTIAEQLKIIQIRYLTTQHNKCALHANKVGYQQQNHRDNEYNNTIDTYELAPIEARPLCYNEW